ncbi:MAG TPA: hypothetical protein VD789_00495 [Thermomicrobiales bacterium]|nr:hypothetical protein [Thermomicrobiales bacterium]
MKKVFHHIGLPAPNQDTPLPGESWVASSGCWVTNPAHHPQRIEYLRYAADSTVDPVFQNAPHICYIVDDLDAAIAGHEIAIAPFEPGHPPFGRAAFTMEDGIAVEYIELYPGRAWFDDDVTQGEET